MVQRIKKQLSVGNVLALVALFVALGGSAYAGAKIGTKQIKNGAVTGSKVSPKLIQWAYISEDGDELNGRNLRSSRRLGTGNYLVTFGSRVTSCSITATPNRLVPNEMAVVATKGTGASSSVTNNRQVEVSIGDDAGFETNQDFFVSVLC